MFAVIKTGGKQYRVQPGDLLVVEKLDGQPGDALRFDQVLAIGGAIGAPLVDGAVVSATLIETRKGEKIKIFKKTRRQGYRRTRGHRQHESVLRVTGIEGDGQSLTWDGEVDLTPLAELNARARGLGLPSTESAYAGDEDGIDVEPVVTEIDGPVVHATVVEHAGPAPETETAAPQGDEA